MSETIRQTGRMEADRGSGVAGGIGQACGQEDFPGTRIANEHNIHVGWDKVEVEQVKDAGLLLLPGFVVAKVLNSRSLPK